MDSAKLHVSICGGGIAGLALAVIIGKYSSTLPVEIFEASPTITTLGAGISFFSRTMEIMKELGLYEQLVDISIERPRENAGPVFRKSDQQEGHSNWFSLELKRSPLAIHRKDLIEFLYQNISPACKVHTSKRLEFYDVHPETGKITLHFSDGSSVDTDVLVGADGIRSTTRKTMYRRLASLISDDDSRKRLLEHSDPIWTGILVYRNLVPIEKLVKEYHDAKVPTNLIVHCGKNKQVVAYPVSQGQLINVIITCYDPDAFGTPFEGRWVTDVSEKEVLDLFEDWEPRVRALVKCFEKPSKWALHSLQPLPHYVDGKVALIGDAAHAMEPHLGAGAGQGIEDAFVLARLLTHESTNRENVTGALKVYEQVRLSFANGILQAAQTMGRYYGLHLQRPADGSVPVYANNPKELNEVRESIEGVWKWQDESVMGIWEEAHECWCAVCM